MNETAPTYRASIVIAVVPPDANTRRGECEIASRRQILEPVAPAASENDGVIRRLVHFYVVSFFFADVPPFNGNFNSDVHGVKRLRWRVVKRQQPDALRALAVEVTMLTSAQTN